MKNIAKKLCLIILAGIGFLPNTFAANLDWVGTSSSWTTPSNWSPGQVPTASDNITISGNLPSGKVYPTLTGTGNCKSITFSSGSRTENKRLDIGSSGLLRVYDSFTNSSGKVDLLGNGNVSFLNSSPSTNVTLTGTTTFGKLTVNKTGKKVTIPSGTTVAVKTFLKLTLGDFEMSSGSGLIFNSEIIPNTGATPAYPAGASDQAATAYFDLSGAGSLTGAGNNNVTVLQCSLNTRSDMLTWGRYTFVGSPIDNNQSYIQLEDELGLTNGLEYNAGYAFPGTDICKFIWYDETVAAPTPTTSSYGYKGINKAGSQTFGSLDGYLILYDPGQTSPLANKTLSWTGTLNLNSSYTKTAVKNTDHSQPNFDGSNIIGNPYPAPLSWPAIYNDGSNVNYSPIILLYEPDGQNAQTGNWKYFDATNDTEIPFEDQNIAIGQGFFITSLDQSAGSGNTTNNSLTISRTHQMVSPGSPRFYRTAVAENFLKLKVEGGIQKDALTVQLGDSYSNEVVPGQDAAKMPNSRTNFYSIADGNQLAINKMALPEMEREIALGIEVEKAGSFTFKADKFKQANEATSIYFVDKAKGIKIPVGADFSYQTDLGAEKNNARFALVVGPKIETKTNGVSTIMYYHDGSLHLQFTNPEKNAPVSYQISDVQGNVVGTGILTIDENKSKVAFVAPSKGIYLMKIIVGNANETQKILVD